MQAFPRAQRAAAFVQRAVQLLDFHGLGRVRPLVGERDDWYMKELGEVMETLSLELEAWCGQLPATYA